MSEFFNLDSPVFRFLARVFDYILVNLLFVALSLPVLTLGPALTALYRCLLKAPENGGSPSVKVFWRAFCGSFRSGLLPGICFLLLGGLLLGTGLFFFPLLANHPEIRSRSLLKPAFIRSVGLLPRTACMAVLWLLPVGLLIFLPKVFLILTFLWLFLWFSLTGAISLRLIAAWLN